MPMLERAAGRKALPRPERPALLQALSEGAHAPNAWPRSRSKRPAEELYYLEGQMDNLAKCEEESELAELREELEKFGYVSARPQPPADEAAAALQADEASPRPRAARFSWARTTCKTTSSPSPPSPTRSWLHAKDMPGSHVIIPGDAPDDETHAVRRRGMAADLFQGRHGLPRCPWTTPCANT